MRLYTIELRFLFCKNFLGLCLYLFCLVLLIRDTNYTPVRSFFIFHIYYFLFNHLKFFAQFSFISFCFLSHILHVPFSRRVLLFKKYCSHSGVCLMRDIIYLFNSFSKFYQPCLVHLLMLLLHLLPESCSPGPTLCWFHREGSLGFWCWSGW